MNKFLSILVAGAIIASTALAAGCAANGKFADKTNGPVDPAVTFKNICNGEKIMDGLWGAAVVASAGKIPAKDVTIEHDAHVTISAICTGPVPVDLTSAILAITADSIPIGQLVQKYTGETVPLNVPPA